MTRHDQVWSAFSGDPRVPGQAVLRASDADRDIVRQVLTDAYADGRLDREELDSRLSTTQAARTLGELVAPLEGLVPTQPVAGASALVPAAELRERAVRSWLKDRREALWGLLSVSAIVWTIWVATSFGDGGFEPYFPWPVFVTLAAAINLGRIQFQRESLIDDEQRRLEKKQRKEIEQLRHDHGEDDA